MSEKETLIEGLVPDNNGANYGYHGRSQNNGQQSRYNQAFGTVIEGETTGRQETTTRRNSNPTKPVIGFLYSVSRTRMGEFWPLQQGRNIIGKDNDCDIVLSEGTVSSEHAVIVIRQGKNGLIAAIRDGDSTNGTRINGEPIDFGAEELHNGDLITIGTHYQLLFILIDAEKIGLNVCKEFVAIEEEGGEDPFDFGEEIPVRHRHTRNMDKPSTPHDSRGFDPFVSGWRPTRGTDSYPSGDSDGTVGMDGSRSESNSGGTVSM